jgi:hypothetical protein
VALGVASVVAGVVLAVAGLFVIRTVGSVQRRMTQRWSEIVQSGELPPNIAGKDLRHVTPADLGVELTPAESARLRIALWIAKRWYLVVGIAVATAVGMSQLTR